MSCCVLAHPLPLPPLCRCFSCSEPAAVASAVQSWRPLPPCPWSPAGLPKHQALQQGLPHLAQLEELSARLASGAGAASWVEEPEGKEEHSEEEEPREAPEVGSAASDSRAGGGSAFVVGLGKLALKVAAPREWSPGALAPSFQRSQAEGDWHLLQEAFGVGRGTEASQQLAGEAAAAPGSAGAPSDRQPSGQGEPAAAATGSAWEEEEEGQADSCLGVGGGQGAGSGAAAVGAGPPGQPLAAQAPPPRRHRRRRRRRPLNYWEGPSCQAEMAASSLVAQLREEQTKLVRLREDLRHLADAALLRAWRGMG